MKHDTTEAAPAWKATCVCDPADVRASAEWATFLDWLLVLGPRLREALDIVQALMASTTWNDRLNHFMRLLELVRGILPNLPNAEAVRSSGADNVAALAAKLPGLQDAVERSSGLGLLDLLKLLPFLKDLLPLLQAIFDRLKPS